MSINPSKTTSNVFGRMFKVNYRTICFCDCFMPLVKCFRNTLVSCSRYQKQEDVSSKVPFWYLKCCISSIRATSAWNSLFMHLSYFVDVLFFAVDYSIWKRKTVSRHIIWCQNHCICSICNVFLCQDVSYFNY